MKMLHMVTFVLLVVGGINWLSVGLLDKDLVMLILGTMPALVKLVYVLVGVSAVYELFMHKKNCRMCDSGATPTM